MGLGQSRQQRWNREPRYPDFPQYQQPTQPFIPNYIPVGYPQPTMYPQPGFIPPVYGQGAVLPPQQLHYFPGDTQRRRRSRRPTRPDTFVGGFVQDQPSPLGMVIFKKKTCIINSKIVEAPRRSASHRPLETPIVPLSTGRSQTRAPTPFIPRRPGPEEEDEEEDEEEEEMNRTRRVPAEPERPASRQSPIHYDQPPATVQGNISAIRPMPPANRSVYGPSGTRPLTPLLNPLPPPPRDLYEMSPYKSLLTLPQTTALLTTTYGPQLGTVAPLAPNGTIKRKNTLFRAFSRKDKKDKNPQPEQQNPVYIPVFLPPQQQQSQDLSRQMQPRQNEAPSRTQPRFQSQQRRPFAGAGPSATTTKPTGASYQPQDNSSSVSNETLSPPIPPRPSNPPTIKFDQQQSYPEFMNHSLHRVIWEGLTYPTALHLHEASKFLGHRPDIAEQIRRCGDVRDVYPLTAKYVGFQRPDWGEQFLPLVYIFFFSFFFFFFWYSVGTRFNSFLFFCLFRCRKFCLPSSDNMLICALCS